MKRLNRYSKLLLSGPSKGQISSDKAFGHSTPNAGVFSRKDLDYLELCQRRAYQAQEMYLDLDAYPKLTNKSVKLKETLSNTIRFYQVPGTNTIYGGRK